MNRDEKVQAINQIVGKLYQYEEVYAQMTFQSNRMLNDELSTKDMQQASFKINAMLNSCVNEEEKLALSLVRQIDDDIQSQTKQRKETRKHARVSRRDSIFESLLDVDRIMTGSTAVAYINNTWILVKVKSIQDGVFTVVDGEENLEHPQQYVVYRQEIINYPASYTQANYTTRDFMLPPGTRVLALWPGSTAFYDAIVLPRSNIPVQLER